MQKNLMFLHPNWQFKNFNIEQAIEDGKSAEEIKKLSDEFQQTITDINNKIKPGDNVNGIVTKNDDVNTDKDKAANNPSRRATLANDVQRLVNKKDATEDEIKDMLRELRKEGRFMGRKQLRRALKDKRREINAKNDTKAEKYAEKANEHLNKAERDLRKKMPDFDFDA